MKLVFLGTSGMVPTKDRNVQSIYMEYNGDGILLDCGEGTQRQITLAKLNAQKIKTILISHWHGDHVSGLVGLIQTLGNFAADGKKVRLFGPIGTKKYLGHLLDSCIFENKLILDVVELNPKNLETFYETEDYLLQSASLDHSVPCIGYRFVRKEKRKMNVKKLDSLGIKGPSIGLLQSGKNVEFNGSIISADEVSKIVPAKQIAFIFDTQLTDNCVALAQDAELLVSEAVYTSEHENKASEYKHLTARQVAQIASQAGVKKLILTHFSQRYKDITRIQEEAKTFFPNTLLAEDFIVFLPV